MNISGRFLSRKRSKYTSETSVIALPEAMSTLFVSFVTPKNLGVFVQKKSSLCWGIVMWWRGLRGWLTCPKISHLSKKWQNILICKSHIEQVELFGWLCYFQEALFKNDH